MSGRNLTNGGTFANRNLINTTVNQLSDITADLPVVYDSDFKISLKGLNSLGASDAGKVIKVASGGNSLEYAEDIARTDAEIRSLLSAISPISYNNSNGQISTTFTADSTTTMTNKTIGDELHGNNNTETYIDFNQLYGFPIYGKYISGSLRSYNMSFKNTAISSTYPFIGVSNAGDMLFHINGVGDAIIVKADRDININVGDLIGDTTGPTAFGKTRMKDIFCRHLYSEALVISNGTASSGYSLYYENSSNGSNYIRLEAPASLASSITATLPSSTGTLLNTAVNQTLNYPLFTKTTGDNPVFAMRDEDLSNWIYMKTPALSSDITLTFPSTDGGTLAITDDIPNLTTAVNFGTSAGSNITIGSSSRQIEFDATNYTFTDTNGTAVFKISDSDIDIEGADFGIKARSAVVPPRMFFWDSDKSHYISLQGQEIGSNGVLTLPHTTATLSYNGQNISLFTNDSGFITASSSDTLLNKQMSWSQITSQPTIPTNNNQLTNGAGYITSSSISSFITATSTETLENKTLKSPIFTSQSGAYEKMILKDENLTHNINIFTPDLTDNINIGFPSATGTLAITDDIHTTAEIRALFSSAGNPITYSNGVIGWTNSENYITTADVASQIASATSISTSSILGNPSRTFGNSLCANTINGTSTTINNLIATGTSGDNARLTLKDNNLDHNAIIKCLNFTQDRTFYFIDDGGSILTSSNTSASHIRGLFSGDTPISVNTSTGAISTTFTPTSTTNISGKTITDELLVSPTNTSSFYIAKLLASSLSSGSVEMVLGKANSANNCSTFNYTHSSDGSTSNNLQIGMKTKETMLQLKGDTNIIMNSNKVDIITPNGTDNCNLILSAGYNPSGSGAGNSAVIQLQNTNSVGTVKKAQLFLNGADDYLVLKNLQGDARIEMVIGSVVASIFEGAYTTINNDLKVNKILARSQTNNIIESNSSYGWEISGTNTSYSFALKNGTSTYMYLGSPSSSTPFQQHINGVGDTYNVTNGRAHNFVGEYLTANSTSLGGSAEAMGFTTYLAASYTSSKFPTVATNGQYLYFSIYNNLGTRTGGTYCGYVGSSGFVDISDKRFKKDITTIANPFNIINNIRGVSFKWNEESGKEDGKEHIGFIAQELNEVLPQVCNYDEKTDSWGIYKADVNAVLVEAVKELKKQVEQQQIIIDKLLSSSSFKEFKS